MHFLHYFNRTHEIYITENWRYYKLFFCFELVIIIINFLHSIFFLNICIYIKKHFHKNWNNIQVYLYSQHLVQCIFWFFQRLLLFTNQIDDSADISQSLSLLISSLIRASCAFSAFFILLIFMIERCCATFYLADYEQQSRSIISYGLIVSIIVVSVLASISFHFVDTTLYHLGAVFMVNILAMGINQYLNKLNQKYHLEVLNSHGNYSLTERYQISENIRICKLVNGMVFSVSIFNTVCALCLVADNLNLSMTLTNLSVAIFDINAFIYSFLLPHIVCRYNSSWKIEAKRSLNNYVSFSSSKVSFEQSVKVKNVHGKVIQINQDVSQHFHNLQKFWDESVA